MCCRFRVSGSLLNSQPTPTMKLNNEYSFHPPAITGEPAIYVSGDDDPDSPDVRLSFVTPHGFASFDMTPRRLRELRDLLSDALRDLALQGTRNNQIEAG